MPLTFSDVEEILRIIDRFPAAEIRFEHGDVKLYVKRAAPAGTVAPAAPPPAAAAPTASTATTPTIAPSTSAPPAPATPAAAPRGDTNVDRSGQMPIESPLAGVFYEAPAPGADPFVRAGQRVAAGAELCIIEVMKVMNTIKAPVGGTVVDVVAENAAAVDKGQPLIWIRPETA
jgi:acetyl-CoA carboxylase biotin carboxyl carrier protein